MKLSRRLLLRRALAVGALGVGLGAFEAARQGLDLLEQHATWEEAARPNAEFRSRHADRMRGLTLGASFAPEQWPLDTNGQRDALQALDLAVRELGLRQLRLGVRWSRAEVDGAVDLLAYRQVLDYCLANGVDLCLNVGSIRTFRWPEEHVPPSVIARLDRLPETGATIGTGDPLAEAALTYVDRLSEALRREYGESLSNGLRAVQIENEPFYPLGAHRWRMSNAYLQALVERVDGVFPRADIIVTSAGRLNLDSIRDLFARLFAGSNRFQGRLVSGFDFHYKTPLRDSFPLVRHFDQVAYSSPFAPTCEAHIRDSRTLGFRIEVTEAQAEPYAQFLSPGNSAKDFRYVVLRCLDKVLDPQAPALVRIWGVEELAKKLLRGDATDEHRQIVELIQSVNGATGEQVRR